jgi:RNA polymerase sigma factor (TIGR02999 family)
MMTTTSPPDYGIRTCKLLHLKKRKIASAQVNTGVVASWARSLSPESPGHITRLLHDWSHGDTSALPRLVEAVYPELRRIAARQFRRERQGHTLQPTALINEAYVRLAQQQPGKHWQDRTHFFAVAARVVRAILVDHARARQAVKRGSDADRVELTFVNASVAQAPVDLLDLDGALQALEALDAEQVRIVELRYFAGLSIEETAEAIHMSPSSVKRGWLAAKTYIRRHLDGDVTPA